MNKISASRETQDRKDSWDENLMYVLNHVTALSENDVNYTITPIINRDDIFNLELVEKFSNGTVERFEATGDYSFLFGALVRYFKVNNRYCLEYSASLS